jgi:citrate synthase
MTKIMTDVEGRTSEDLGELDMPAQHPLTTGYLTSEEAADALGVTLATLYAYVSRGLISSEPVPGSRRARRYRAEDVRRLQDRQDLRRNPAAPVEGALRWGMPVLESSVMLIEHGRAYYRGYDITDLAHNESFERVMALLWAGNLNATLPAADVVASAGDSSDATVTLDTLGQLQLALLNLAAGDPTAYDLRRESLMRAGQRVVRRFVETASGVASDGDGIAATLQRGWVPAQPDAERVINAALILCADHELNVSSFTVRCIASAGAPLYAAMMGGLSALQGSKHGGSTLRVAALLDEVREPAAARAVLANRLRRGEEIPSFGHVLYPDGDPRGETLLGTVREAAVVPEALALADAVIEAALDLTGRRPSLDFALVVAARALHLGIETPLTLFALGRTAGWIAHAIEEYDRDQLIRPRARYVGPPPLVGEGFQPSRRPLAHAQGRGNRE